MVEVEKYDIIIIGGGLAASILALNVLNRDKNIRLAIIERTAKFPEKLGESTSDISALMLKKLGIKEILAKHKTKGGLRFVFDEKNNNCLTELASPTLKAPYQGYHFNRQVLDEDLLSLVQKRGAFVYRPAEILNLETAAFHSVCTIKESNEKKKLTARWLIDATGRSRFLHNKLNWPDLEIDLKTAALSAIFTNIKPEEDWDLPKNTYWEKNAIASRHFSTLHLLRENGWWWIIRIDEERTSIGYVFKHDSAPIEKPEMLFEKHLKEDAQLSRIAEGAEYGEVKTVDQIAYVSENHYSEGIALIGESGAFTDPMVGPGIELICQQAVQLSELLKADVVDNNFNKHHWNRYNKTFKKAFLSRITIYTYGYEFMGSHDLFTNWLRSGNWVYFGLHVFPGIQFPNRLKKPFSLNKFERLGLKYLNWRLTKIHQRRKKQNRSSELKPNFVTYSGIRIPKGIQFYWVPIELFFRWIWDYIKLEFNEIRFIFKK